MEGKRKSANNKSGVIILTPDEVAKLGILNNYLPKNDSVPSTSNCNTSKNVKHNSKITKPKINSQLHSNVELNLPKAPTATDAKMAQKTNSRTHKINLQAGVTPSTPEEKTKSTRKRKLLKDTVCDSKLPSKEDKTDSKEVSRLSLNKSNNDSNLSTSLENVSDTNKAADNISSTTEQQNTSKRKRKSTTTKVNSSSNVEENFNNQSIDSSVTPLISSQENKPKRKRKSNITPVIPEQEDKVIRKQKSSKNQLNLTTNVSSVTQKDILTKMKEKFNSISSKINLSADSTPSTSLKENSSDLDNRLNLPTDFKPSEDKSSKDSHKVNLEHVASSPKREENTSVLSVANPIRPSDQVDCKVMTSDNSNQILTSRQEDLPKRSRKSNTKYNLSCDFSSSTSRVEDRQKKLRKSRQSKLNSTVNVEKSNENDTIHNLPEVDCKVITSDSSEQISKSGQEDMPKRTRKINVKLNQSSDFSSTTLGLDDKPKNQRKSRQSKSDSTVDVNKSNENDTICNLPEVDCKVKTSVRMEQILTSGEEEMPKRTKKINPKLNQSSDFPSSDLELEDEPKKQRKSTRCRSNSPDDVKSDDTHSIGNLSEVGCKVITSDNVEQVLTSEKEHVPKRTRKINTKFNQSTDFPSSELGLEDGPKKQRKSTRCRSNSPDDVKSDDTNSIGNLPEVDGKVLTSDNVEQVLTSEKEHVPKRTRKINTKLNQSSDFPSSELGLEDGPKKQRKPTRCRSNSPDDVKSDDTYSGNLPEGDCEVITSDNVEQVLTSEKEHVPKRTRKINTKLNQSSDFPSSELELEDGLIEQRKSTRCRSNSPDDVKSDDTHSGNLPEVDCKVITSDKVEQVLTPEKEYVPKRPRKINPKINQTFDYSTLRVENRPKKQRKSTRCRSNSPGDVKSVENHSIVYLPEVITSDNVEQEDIPKRTRKIDPKLNQSSDLPSSTLGLKDRPKKQKKSTRCRSNSPNNIKSDENHSIDNLPEVSSNVITPEKLNNSILDHFEDGVKKKGKRGRAKKVELAVIDDDGKKTCAVCLEKLNDDKEWFNHNEDYHNNLAWREGEVAISLDDLPTVNQKLKKLLLKQKPMICPKCKMKFTKTNIFILHIEECKGIIIDGNVICAVCNTTLTKDKWSYHKQKHNNLAWRIGDAPLDINNETYVLQVLNALYKAKKPLYCEKCGIVKKSVLGLLSHRDQCGVEDATIQCELCGKSLLPVSMPSHMKMIHDPKKSIAKPDFFNVDLNSTHTKRKAATKALSKIGEFTDDFFKDDVVVNMKFDEFTSLGNLLNKELDDNKSVKCKIKNCEETCDDVLALISHMKICSSKLEQYYTCKKCFIIDSSKEEIIKHLETVHLKVKPDVDFVYSNDEIDEFENENKPTKKKVKNLSEVKNSDIRVIVKPDFIIGTSKYSKTILFSHAFKYTFEFCQRHFKEVLFENFISDENNFQLVKHEVLEYYLPPANISCDIVKKPVHGYELDEIYSKTHTFKKFQLYEIEQDDNITIFCGGPINCLAWLPTPYTSLNETQILAVGIGINFDTKYYYQENYKERTSIQFWNFGVLKNTESMPKPRLEFSLAVDIGPIWYMEWCPSGCYNIESKVNSRIGLLAVAGSALDVNIYSIPFIKEDNVGLFYKTKPVLKLRLVINENELKRKIFPTKTSWSKVSEHSTIAVGYTDGTVALYDLNTSSNLLKYKNDDKIDVLLPFKTITAHSHYISVLSLVPICEENRWLLTGSFDKKVILWDLYNNDKFLDKKIHITCDGTWLTNWLCHIVGVDETTPTNGKTIASILYHREYLCDTCSATTNKATVNSISSNDWINGFVQSTCSGEMVAFFPHQMLYDIDRLKKAKSYQFLRGYTLLLDKTLSPEDRKESETKKKSIMKPSGYAYKILANMGEAKEIYDIPEPLDYNEAIKQYGVAFCDIPTDKRIISWNRLDAEYSKPNIYPLQNINKICYNPNRQASLYYASGYQIGFLRLFYLKFLENDFEVKKAMR